MITPQVNVKELQALHHHAMLLGMHYSLGSKIPLSTPEAALRGRSVDCSGWSRYLIYHATDGKLTIPDGSYNQKDWFATRAARVPYDSVRDNPNELHIAFISPTPEHQIGHVWLVREHWTYESHGGVGPNSRVWDTRILRSEVSACYVIPHCWK